MSTIIGNPIMLGGGGDITIPTIGKDFTWTGGDGTYQVLDDGDKNWRIKFLSSGVFTPLKTMAVDVFLVGGGGSGTARGTPSLSSYGSGGGGGYTVTEKSRALIENIAYTYAGKAYNSMDAVKNAVNNANLSDSEFATVKRKAESQTGVIWPEE